MKLLTKDDGKINQQENNKEYTTINRFHSVKKSLLNSERS